MAAGWAHAVAAGRASRKARRRILGVDLAAAEGLGDLMARGSKIGLSLSVMDAFFAATAGFMGSRWLPGIPSTSKDWALV